MNKKLELSKEKRQEMISIIKSYFADERNEDLGDLSAMLILDFFIEKLAPDFYNQGINDSYKYLTDKIEDLFAIQIIKK